MNVAMRARRLFQRWVLQRTWTCFVALGISFIGFGLGTLHLATFLKANLDLVADYGWQALMDGAAQQFVELLVNGYVSMAFYVVFKTCEYRLVHGLERGVE